MCYSTTAEVTKCATREATTMNDNDHTVLYNVEPLPSLCSFPHTSLSYDAILGNTTACTTSVSSNVSDKETYWQSVVADVLYTYVPPIIVIIGTIGNSLSFLVSRRRSMKRCSVGFCLSFLAISDLVAVYFGITRNWTKHVFGWDIRSIDQSLCKIHRYVLYCSLDYSAWILVVITVERFISVCYPFKANTLCSLSKTKKVLVILAITIASENLGVFFVRGKEVLSDGNVTHCGYPSVTAKHYWTQVRPWCVIALYAVIPFTIMIFCSIRIVWRLRKARAEMALLFYPESKSQSTQSLDRLHVPNGNSLVVCERQKKGAVSTTLKRHLESYKMYSMTIMSLVVAVVFLCLVIPSHLEFFLERYWNKKDALEWAKFQAVEAFTRTLLYTNHAINFFVYMASGRKFRREFVRMILRKDDSAMTSSQVNSVVYNTVRMTNRTALDRSPCTTPMLGGRRGAVIS